MAVVLLVGTLDTKAEEYAWLRERLREHGVGTCMMDVGSFSRSPMADVTSDEVIVAAGEDPEELRAARDRGRSMTVMSRGAAVLARGFAQKGRIHGLLGVGGSGGSSVVGGVMQALPIGLPKLLVSTMASGDVRRYVGDVDATIMYSVVDIAGVNGVSAPILGNACAAIASMARAHEKRRSEPAGADRPPVVAITMFGLTTPAADEAEPDSTSSATRSSSSTPPAQAGERWRNSSSPVSWPASWT